MRPLSTPELLYLWEQGLSQTAMQRGLELIAAACPELSMEQVVRLSIGQRDRLLLTLREQLFGSQLVSVADCPVCGDRLELNFSVAEIRLPAAEVPSVIEVQQGGYRVQVRLPNSLDLAAMVQWQTAALPELRRRLLGRCLMAVRRDRQEALEPENLPDPNALEDSASQPASHAAAMTVADLPEEVVTAIATQLAAADPQADIQLDLGCLACGHQWQAAFDIGAFLWSEIHAWAVRLLREVHVLASAYGWSEADILALSAQRRQWYLEMVGSV